MCKIEADVPFVDNDAVAMVAADVAPGRTGVSGHDLAPTLTFEDGSVRQRSQERRASSGDQLLLEQICAPRQVDVDRPGATAGTGARAKRGRLHVD